MCLKIAHRNLKTVPIHKEGKSSNERKVYKVLVVKEEKFYSPFCNFKWTLGVTYEDPNKPDVKTVKSGHRGTYRMVGKGFFHTFTNIKEASKLAEYLANKYPKHTIVIHEAIIPEGTKYYEGTCGDLCTKSLKILDKNVPILESNSSTGS